jgi:hypothetical protein
VNLRDEVLRVVMECKKDFILTDTVVKRVSGGCLMAPPRADIVAALDELWKDGEIRHPATMGHWVERDRRRYPDWWRDARRGYTRQERRTMLRGLFTFRLVDLGRADHSAY